MTWAQAGELLVFILTAIAGKTGRAAGLAFVTLITQLAAAATVTQAVRETGDYKAIELELRGSRYPNWTFVAGGVA